MIKSILLGLSVLALSVPAFAATTTAPPAPAAQKWTVDPAASTIEFSGTNAGKEFTGSFKTWSAEIAFDAKNLEASSVTVTVETGSAVTGDKMYDGTLPTPEWLDIKAFPAATFTATTFRQTGDTTFEADGTLKLKGIEKSVTLPFTLTIEGNAATMEAHLTVDRLGFTVGQASDPKGEWVSKDIGVSIALKATRAP